MRTVSDRRADVDLKTARVGALLQALGCEGLFLFEPENLAWLASGATSRGLPDPAATPAAYCNGDQRGSSPATPTPSGCSTRRSTASASS